MSLAMVLANQYGIVMSADKRMTLAPKTSDGQTFLYPSLNHQQKLFMTKSGHGIAFTGTLTLDDGTATAVVIKNAIAKYNSPRTSVLDELKGLKNALSFQKAIVYALQSTYDFYTVCICKLPYALHIIACFDVVTGKPGKVLYDDRFHRSVLHVLNQLLERRAACRGAGIAIVHVLLTRLCSQFGACHDVPFYQSTLLPAQTQ